MPQKAMSLPHDIWISPQRKSPARRGLFLDRDGVVIADTGYTRNAGDVRLVPGIIALLCDAMAQGIALVVVTNQSGIARGLFGWTEFRAVEDEIARQLAQADIVLNLVLACPYHPDFTPGYGETEARWRKPGPAMLLQGIKALQLDAADCWMIGDRLSDVQAAQAAGLAGAVLVGGAESASTDGFTCIAANDLEAAHAALKPWLSREAA